MYQGERIRIYLLQIVFWMFQSIKLVYFIGFVSEFLEVPVIFEALVLLFLVDCKERRRLLFGMDFNGVPWRVLIKFSLTWLTAFNGRLLRHVLNASPFVFRLVLFLLKFMSRLAGWWMHLMVEAIEQKNEKMAGKFSKTRELKVVQYDNLVSSFQSQKAIILLVCSSLRLVYVMLSVFVMEVLLPPYI